MLVYLSKKIAIPNGICLQCISWSSSKGYIACGGDEGLLKVLKLETQTSRDAVLKGLAAPSNLCMNQSLEAHEGRVQVVIWNEHHNKLTSSDENGLIVVWNMYKGTWYEEMINNRNKSVVRHMCWNKDGKKICIVYEDGLVILGSVEGSRIWAKELKMHLNFVQWSPDGRYILFGNLKAEVHIYDNLGSYVGKMAIHCLSSVTGAVQLAGLEWYIGKGYGDPNCPSLAVCFDNGRAQLMRHELDPAPVKIDTGIMVSCIKWNINGKLLAFAGTHSSQDKEYNVVQFYNPMGQHLYTLRIPGKSVSAITWEIHSLRVALAVDSFIYFANIRHDYKWGYFSKTVVYSYIRPDKPDQNIMFWNTQTNERNYKSVKKLLFLETCQDYCLMVSQMEDGQYSLLLCNDLGTPVDSRYLDIEPLFACISHTHIAVATRNVIYTWHYRTTSRLATSEVAYTILRKGREGKEMLLHVDEVPVDGGDHTIDNSKIDKATFDPICCICASDRSLAVGRVSGKLQFYSLPKMSLVGKVLLNCRPHWITLNCDSTKLSVIDINGVLGLIEVRKPSLASSADDQIGKQLPMERKEVWDLCWADDNPDMFAMMEKTRMYIFRGLDPEEPIVCSGHICSFSDLQVKSVLMDEIMKDPDNPAEDFVAEIEVKSLRDSRDLLEKVGIHDASQFIEDNPHPRLWRLLAEAAIEKLELEVAEKAFVHSRDYQGIQFVKRLKKLDSDKKQLAEVAAYFKRFEEAERIYIEMDRRDLAVELRTKLGDWFRVIQLLKQGGGTGNDALLAQAWNAIGDYYADRQKWQHAVTYYSQGRNQDRLAECFYRLEDYKGLQDLSSTLPDGHPLLETVAKMFVKVGMCQQAVSAFLKCPKVDEAIDVCVQLNEWDQAIELANQKNVKDVDKLLVKYANHLLEKDRKLTAIALYHKASRFIEAAKLLQQVAKEQSANKASPIIMKKLHVLCGLLIESYRTQLKNKQQQQQRKTDSKPEILSSLQGVLAEEANTLEDSRIIDNAWRGAEAYHFFLLAQRQLYEGNREASLRTALGLVDYDDIIPPSDVHSLVALISALHQAFSQCSKAFVILESLGNISDEKRTQLSDLSLEIFTRHTPRDVVSNKTNCPDCGTMINDWDLMCTECGNKFPRCIASGQPLLDYHYWSCSACKHRALENEITSYNNCPLCHTPV